MSSEGLVYPYLGIMLVAIAPLSLGIVLYYAEPGFPWHTYITLFVGYYASFAILLLVPIDIAAVVVDRRSNVIGSDSNYDSNKKHLSTAYDAFFTIILILGSFVLVFEEYYNTDGYFTLGGRLASSFKRMCIDMAGGVVAGLIVLGILLGQNIVGSSADALKLAAVIVTNTVYEAFLMFLIAYALIEYPRSLWAKSNLDKFLLMVQTKAAAEFKDISDFQLSVSLAVSDVLKTKSQLASYADPKLTAAMDVLIAECPPEFRSDRMGKVAANKAGQVTVDTLAALRTRLNTLKDQYKMAQAKIEVTKLLAYRLEDIVAAKNANNGQGSQVIRWTLVDQDSTRNEYLWEIRAKPILFKISAVCCAVLSLFSFLGVVCSMQGVSNNVSVYFLAVHDKVATPGGITIFILVTLGYVTYITSWSLFQMRLAGLMELVPNRTTPESLSFNVRMIARLAAPLAFFFLGWISENGIKSGSWQYNNAPNLVTYQNVTTVVNGTSTTQLESMTTSQSIFMPSAFSNFYQLQSVYIIQSTFGTLFPILLFCLLFLFVTNFFNRILVLLKMDTYQFGAQIVTDEQLREGKRQLQRHRKNTERHYKRGLLRSIIANISGAKAGETSFLSRLLGGGTSKTTKKGPGGAVDVLAEPSMREPPPLSGLLERKAGYTIGVGAAYREVYAEVLPPGFLHFYKDKITAIKAVAASRDPSQSPDPTATVVDLRSVMDFKTSSKVSGKDSFVLEMDLVNGTEHLRFKMDTELERWKRMLCEWKDFHTDYGALYVTNMSANPAGSMQPRASITAIGMSSNSGVGRESEMVRGSVTSSAGANSKGFLGLGGGAKKEVDAAQRDQDDMRNMQLDNDLEDDTEDEEKGGKTSSSTFSFSGGFKKAAAPVVKAAAPPAKLETRKPKPLEGWLEKKGHGKMHLGGDWQRRYLRVDELSSSLIYSKSSDRQEKPQGVIDLKLVGEVAAYTGSKGQQDSTRFEVDVGDKVFKFKAASEADGRRWIDGLNEWRDYFLLNM
mmetsp:Transcript_7381/g.10461  ORF Transcript_7381/g.10461 Transcript_7381/m.10461 type:complete len:1010 (-) Transcript_7381:824-3853(-)